MEEITSAHHTPSPYSATLEEWRKQGMLRELRHIEHDGAYVIEGGRRMLNLSGNDYLGIASRGDLDEAMTRWAQRYGYAGSTSSRLLTGGGQVYDELERAIAQSFSREAALLFGSGYHMNLGILPALADAKTMILADKLVHASIIDGIRLSGMPWERFRHGDMAHLEKLITKHRAEYARLIVVVESLYSMDGDRADLVKLVELRRQYPEVMLYVDEAHAIGVCGDRGLGLAEETNTIQEIDLLLGTFGKALASMGGYLVCSQEMKQYLVNRCRSLIFSTALPPLTVATTLEAWRRLPQYTQERLRLAQSSERLRHQLSLWGITSPSTSHIVPIVLGEAEEAVRVSQQLQRLGYYALPIRPPTVPPGRCRLRLSLTADLDVEPLITALGEVLSR